MIGLLGVAGLAAAVVAVTRKATSAATESLPNRRLCDGPPPSPQPSAPAGFRIFRGKVDAGSEQNAVNMLGAPIGTFRTFTMPNDGRLLGGLVNWHCDESRGWHKGVTLFEKV